MKRNNDEDFNQENTLIYEENLYIRCFLVSGLYYEMEILYRISKLEEYFE